MSENIVAINEEAIKKELKELVKESIEETLNALLDAEAEELLSAARYERSEQRQGYRAGHYERNILSTAGEITVKMPKTKGVSFETAIIERYRRKEASVEEALIEMYLAGVSVRRVEDITEALWGAKVSASTVSDLNQKAYANIEQWRNRPIEGEFPYVYVDGIWLKRSWGGEYENISVLVAIGVGKDGHRHILGACEGMKESKADWEAFFTHLAQRGLKGVQLVIGDKRAGIEESAASILGAKYQRCIVHFARNIQQNVPRKRMEEASLAIKAIWAQENRQAAKRKAAEVASQLREWKLEAAASTLENGIEDALAYYSFPSKHWRLIRTNNMLERVNREIRRRTRVVGAFPDGQSALMLVCARLRYIEGKQWGTKAYMSFAL
ncbi:MAG: IS256 family transposase [Eubacteriaceae bacterium]|nr:IS256 family transposase [Eubacteriaceae bacterium]